MAARRTDPDADLERAARDVALGPQGGPRVDPPVCLVVDHYRHRLADPDGLSSKAALDALVRAGVLRDDSQKYISEVRHRQHKIPKAEAEHTTLSLVAVS